MELPFKVKQWFKRGYFPQRCLFSGGEEVFSLVTQIASQVNQCSLSNLLQGIESDVLLLRDDGNSFKIGDEQNPELNSARGLIQWISQKPIAPYRIVILENFERASREAPQTLLKILEEPPKQALFLFTTKNHHQILPTIISRMTVITVPQNYDNFSIDAEIKAFLQKGNLTTKLKKIDRLEAQAKEEGEKNILHDFMSKLLLHSRYFPQYQKHLEEIFITDQLIRQNVNSRLLLERLALKLSNE